MITRNIIVLNQDGSPARESSEELNCDREFRSNQAGGRLIFSLSFMKLEDIQMTFGLNWNQRNISVCDIPIFYLCNMQYAFYVVTS